MRSSSFRRHMMWKKAKRKKNMDDPFYPRYNNLHQYSKNTIHCSCPDCQQKTRNKGKRRYKSGNYAPSKNYKHAEYKRIIGMDYDEFEIYIEES